MQESLNEIISMLDEMKKDIRGVKQRMLSLETWMAALSKGKNLQESNTFNQNMTKLEERIHPTIDMEIEEITLIE